MQPLHNSTHVPGINSRTQCGDFFFVLPDTTLPWSSRILLRENANHHRHPRFRAAGVSSHLFPLTLLVFPACYCLFSSLFRSLSLSFLRSWPAEIASVWKMAHSVECVRPRHRSTINGDTSRRYRNAIHYLRRNARKSAADANLNAARWMNRNHRREKSEMQERRSCARPKPPCTVASRAENSVTPTSREFAFDLGRKRMTRRCVAKSIRKFSVFSPSSRDVTRRLGRIFIRLFRRRVLTKRRSSVGYHHRRRCTKLASNYTGNFRRTRSRA